MYTIEIHNEIYDRDIIDKMSLVAQFHVIAVWFKHIWFISFHIKRDILHGPYLVRAGVASICEDQPYTPIACSRWQTFSLAPTDTTSQDISPFYTVFLANLNETHPGASELLRSGVISEARSFMPGNRCSVHKTIEETFKKHDKSHGGPGGCGAGVDGDLNQL